MLIRLSFEINASSNYTFYSTTLSTFVVDWSYFTIRVLIPNNPLRNQELKSEIHTNSN